MNFSIRKAIFSDTQDIYSILLQYSNKGVILERSTEDIKKNIDNFYIANVKKSVIGVISYYHYSDRLIEVRSLAVKKKYNNNGIGAALLNVLVNKLLNKFPNAKIFALSYLPEFFKKYGFIEVLRDDLPEKIWKDCKNCLNQLNCGETALVLSK